MDRETLRRIVLEKLKKNTEGKVPIDFSDMKKTHVKNATVHQNGTDLENENLENQTPVNPSGLEKTHDVNDGKSQPGETNTTESRGDKSGKVEKVAPLCTSGVIENRPMLGVPKILDGESSISDTDARSATFSTFPPMSTQNPVVKISSRTEKIENVDEDREEEEGVRITGDRIVIVVGKKPKRKFEIYYKLIGTVEDSTRIVDLKVPRLPQFELVAKKPDDTLRLNVVIDFATTKEGKTVYFVRDKREVVDRLYKFKGDKHITKALINDALDVWVSKLDPEKLIEWVDVREVVKRYPEWDEINRDPLTFFLSRSTEVVGNEKLKVAVLLAVVSSQLKKLFGIYRVHLVLSGSSGVGKSSTIKSVLKLFFNEEDRVSDYVVLDFTRLTKEALGRLQVDTMDGKVFFVEQLDNIEGVNYLREAMSEGKIKTLTTVKDADGNLVSRTIVIPGQPAFIATNVTANIDHQILNRSVQLYLSPAEDEAIKERIITTILLRRPVDDEDLRRIKLVTYVWLKTRPSDPVLREEVAEEVKKVLKKFINFRNIYRATEITRNFIRATASLFGHEEVQVSDVEFVMRYFKKDIILTTLELSERDLQLLKWLRDHGYVEPEGDQAVRDVPTTEVAQFLKLSTVETKKVLDSLYDKGLVWKAYDGKKFTWAVSKYGVKVLEELEQEVGEKKEVNADFDVDELTIAYIRSKLDGKGEVTDDELSKILKITVQATDPESQEAWREVLQQLGVIEPAGDGKWKVRN